ncbi:MAG: hypothetical protein JW729_09605, partial [Bacteroidales bacterium]|nr:hypothetical protein [Bacteroidales bacterium]
YDTKNPQSPIFNFNMNIVNFDFNQVFKTFTSIQPLIPLAEKTKGKFSATMKISSELDEQMKPKLGTLNAAGSLTTSQISISDFQPLLKLADALKNDKLKSISLNEVFLSFQIADGKAFIEPFDFAIGNIKAQFAGYSSLDQTINYVTNLDIPRTEFGESANNLLLGLESEAKNLGVNLKVSDIVKVNAIITGSITNPNVKIQLQDAVEGNPIDDLKKQAEDEINKQKEELEKKAQEEVDKLKQQAEDEIERLKKETEEKAKQEELRLQQEAEAKKKAIEDSIKKAAEEEAKKKLKKLF